MLQKVKSNKNTAYNNRYVDHGFQKVGQAGYQGGLLPLKSKINNSGKNIKNQ